MRNRVSRLAGPVAKAMTRTGLVPGLSAPQAPLLSIVIPCFNEEEVIRETVRRLQRFRAELVNLDCELIFVDDGSRDATREILRALAADDPTIRLIWLSRNFGHQIAATAGIDATSGDAVVLIDADLQDPPELIHQMINKWKEGHDVVYGTRSERQGETAFKRATAKLFYRLLDRLSESAIPVDTGDFRLMSRKVIDALRAMPERDRFIRGMVSWVGFSQTALPYARSKRYAGRSKYSLGAMVRFAADGILSFSTTPLRLSTLMGAVCVSIASLGIIFSIGVRLFAGHWPAGSTAMMTGVLLLAGFQLVALGIMGEYVGRIYNETKSRPLYIVQERFGFQGDVSSGMEDRLAMPERQRESLEHH